MDKFKAPRSNKRENIQANLTCNTKYSSSSNQHSVQKVRMSNVQSTTTAPKNISSVQTKHDSKREWTKSTRKGVALPDIVPKKHTEELLKTYGAAAMEKKRNQVPPAVQKISKHPPMFNMHTLPKVPGPSNR
jgi:hypothetical protein